MKDETRILLHKHRAPCPSCKRKGLGYAGHLHAFGYRDYSRAKCRYCKKYFRLTTPAR